MYEFYWYVGLEEEIVCIYEMSSVTELLVCECGEKSEAGNIWAVGHKKGEK